MLVWGGSEVLGGDRPSAPQSEFALAWSDTWPLLKHVCVLLCCVKRLVRSCHATTLWKSTAASSFEIFQNVSVQLLKVFNK